MNRRRTAAAVLAVAAAASALGFVAGSRISSPAEEAAKTKAPAASLIFVPAEERVLSSDVVTRGTGRFGSPQKLAVVPSALKTNAGVIADHPSPGAELVEGSLVASASGRPVFLLVGARPSSRDLGPGSFGDDVKQLEAAVARLGFNVGLVDGIYDAQTEQGIAIWYSSNGYPAFTATAEQLANARSRAGDVNATAESVRPGAGVQVPSDEVIFVRLGPLRVSELLVGRGDSLVGAVMTVTDAVVRIDGGLAVEDVRLVKPGMSVQIAEADLGINTKGVLKSLASAPGTNGVDGFHVYFEVQIDGAPTNLVGASVRVTIPVESTGGAVLVVPVSAVMLATDGTSRVQRKVGDATEFVAVRPGLSAQGFVAVAAIDATLKVGDLVVIGSDQASVPT